MYENKKSSSYLDTFRQWLVSEDPELETCASLAIGNFACNETHCTELVSNGTSCTLIQLLGMRQNSFEYLKLQHALLGALKNLAVAPSSRLILLQQGIFWSILNWILEAKLLHNIYLTFLTLLKICSFRTNWTLPKSWNDDGTGNDESTNCLQIVGHTKAISRWASRRGLQDWQIRNNWAGCWLGC